ncbi:RHS repeat-associated core domain-containing protein [Anoxybacillus sp. J5B_2022]|uniref:RHS repeat-associated core domain-containing protein n=1 Tax=Anoxybacillus sp. J5B_2022 TaxID=3003246 RepID=UPI0022856DCE|nr:RHS repeat-associated core domain-containing protein [Anoxybacillus sp. J5B_2022]MCZ0756688.1 hypothetical protein [Anoxybacillus sp. J5B_2022]
MFRNLPFKAIEFAGEGHLIYVKDLSGNTTASFTYHPDGLRKTKTVGSTTYHYHYDGSDLIRITDDNGQTVWAFTWANGKPNTVTNSNGNTFYYVTNYRGDVMRIVDENGATVASYSYDPWGKVLSVSEDTGVAGQPLGYAGYYYDKETKLYYLQARYYDPETARFISRDPNPGDLDNPISQNGYVYVDNNPITYVDPDGNKSKKPKNDPTDTVLTVTTALVSLVSTLREMGIYFLKVSWHAAERMIEREVTSKMIAKAIKHGKVYYDPWYSSYVYYYNGLAVAVTKGKTITTVYWGKPKKRWIKIK